MTARKKSKEFIAVDKPVYLHRDSSRGYTTSRALAMPGEPEVFVTSGDLKRYGIAVRMRRK